MSPNPPEVVEEEGQTSAPIRKNNDQRLFVQQVDADAAALARPRNTKFVCPL